MLTYHPAFDLYHCTFRILQILNYLENDSIELERLQIWDFFYLFPTEINRHFKFTQELTKLRRIFKFNENPYEEIVDSKRVFVRMKPYQKLALRNLSSYGIIEKEAYEKEMIKLNVSQIPTALKSELGNLSPRQENVIKLITSPFNELPLYGDTGFKMRTGLITFRYDKEN